MQGPLDRIKRDTRLGLAALTFDFKPAEPTIQTLRNRRRRLCGAAVALHANGPRFGFGAVGFTDGFVCILAGTLGTHACTHDATAPNDLARLRAHARRL